MVSGAAINRITKKLFHKRKNGRRFDHELTTPNAFYII